MKQGYTTWLAPVSISLLLHLIAVLAYQHQSQRPAPVYFDTLLVEMQTVSATPAALPVNKPQPRPEKKIEPDKQPEVEPTPVTQEAAATPQPSASLPVEAISTANTSTQQDIQPLSKLTRPPSFLRKIDPVYPASELRSGSQAYVLAEVTLDAEGKLLDVKILKSAGMQFDNAVSEAIRSSVFQPGYIESKPVAVRVQIPFRFKLK